MIYTDLPLQPPDQGQISAWTKWKVLDLLREEKDYMLQVLKEWANLNQQEPGEYVRRVLTREWEYKSFWIWSTLP